MSEETVCVNLGDDYHQGPYFSTAPGVHLDYEVPKAQLERWEAAAAAYGQMQSEIEQVMQEQGNRVLALYLERRKGQPSAVPDFVQQAYGDAIARVLKQSLPMRKEPSP